MVGIVKIKTNFYFDLQAMNGSILESNAKYSEFIKKHNPHITFPDHDYDILEQSCGTYLPDDVLLCAIRL
jgi:hypothetical protein